MAMVLMSLLLPVLINHLGGQVTDGNEASIDVDE